MQRPVRITRMPKGEFTAMILELNARNRGRIREPQLPLNRLSKALSERLATDRSAPVPECVTCGVCCNFALYVPVTREESERLSEYVEVTADGSDPPVVIDHYLPRDRETGSCKHLSGTLGEQVGCRIYEERPFVCHDFDAGSDRCHEYRRMYGIEPQLSEEEAAEALKRVETLTVGKIIKDVVIAVDSKVARGTMTADGIEFVESTVLKMYAYLDEDDVHELHTYEADKEVWFENELVGYTLEEARERIAARLVG